MTERKSSEKKMPEKKLFRVGVITSVHGVKGEVKVHPTTEDAHRFSLLSEVFFSPGEDERELYGKLSLAEVKYLPEFVILRFRGVSTPEAAMKLKGGSLWIEPEEALPLQEDEFYIADVLGSSCREDTGALLGEVTDVLSTGANLVLEVTLGEEGAAHLAKPSGEKLYLPVIRECVLSIDAKAFEVVIHRMEGLY